MQRLKLYTHKEERAWSTSLGQPIGTAPPRQEVRSLAPPDELQNGETDSGVKSKGWRASADTLLTEG